MKLKRILALVFSVLMLASISIGVLAAPRWDDCTSSPDGYHDVGDGVYCIYCGGWFGK